MGTWIKKFNELGRNDAPIAGGKGASLGEMTCSGIPVPPGFVVLSSAFERFLTETHLHAQIDAILESVNHEAIHTVDAASEQIKELILGQKMPKDIEREILVFFKQLNAKFVAVRSSATAEDGASHAWAGQLESYLNTTSTSLLENVKRCWASLFTPRAIFYRFEKKLNSTKISVAVVVQQMVQSEVSGIAFSVHPVTQDYNQLIIEAGFGLGEAIVSGQITPDSYVAEKKNFSIIEKNIASQERGMFKSSSGSNEWEEIKSDDREKQKLNDLQIFALSKIILQIEKHYGFPCDIEWAFEGGKFYIVQSRPITTLTTLPPENNVKVVEGKTKKRKLKNAKSHGDAEKKDERVAPADAISDSADKANITKIKLSKIFSREKPVAYFCMWNESDRIGYQKFVNHDVSHNLFIYEPSGKKGSVWYESDELAEIESKTKDLILAKKSIAKPMADCLSSNWKILEPFLIDIKQIASVSELMHYYKHLVEWWSAMNTAFVIPDMKELPKDTCDLFLESRTRCEKYTEKMSKLMVHFWENNHPKFAHLSKVLTPYEMEIVANKNTKDLSEYTKRLSGCFILDGLIYTSDKLDLVLKQNNLTLEQKESMQDKLTGTIAFKGKVTGTVRIVSTFADMTKVKTGDILVTEMTNPDYLPALKLAGGFVTDEGGAMCHAAIIARELKKPAIIGTKIATKVFKDGDLVEVDANKGVVTILSSQIKKVSELFAEPDDLNNMYPLVYNGSVFVFGSGYNTQRYFSKKIAPNIPAYHVAIMDSTEKSMWTLTKAPVDYLSRLGFCEFAKSGEKKFVREAMFKSYIPSVHEKYSLLTPGAINKMSPSGMSKELRELLDNIWTANAWAHFSILFDKETCKRICTEEKLDITYQHIENVWERATHLVTPSFDVEQQKHVLRLIAQHKSWDDIAVECQYIFSSYNDVISIEDTKQRLQKMYAEFNAKKAKIKLEQINEHYENNLKEYDLWLATLQKPEQIIAKYCQMVMRVRDARKNLFNMAITSMWRIATKIFVDADVDTKLIRYVLINEELIRGRTYISQIKNKLQERTLGCSVLTYFDGTQVLTTGQASTDIEYLQKLYSKQHEHLASKTELSGQIAYKGKVTGKARVVLKVTADIKLKKGEILIAGMTRPEYVPLMKQAAAIVTDEGGITCHAAIVSRELKIPCVIGTKVATRVFKDGDLIEVDASKGIVRKI